MSIKADFRSDTVTRPTREMIEVMMTAPLGDDVFGDDPSVNALEAKAAAMFGMEAALFCPSGTMCNQIAIKVHTQPGDEVVCDKLAHIYNYEGGGIAFNSACSVRLLEGDGGRFTARMVEEAINPDDPHFAHTALVSVENTCNKGGGAIWDTAELKNIGNLCRTHNLKFHLDGARLFNALVVTKESPGEIGTLFDSISICMSKGLGCPIGSVLLGSRDMIHRARRIRKVFGGGMRQAGMLAAAASYALDHHVERLAEDHDRARQLAETLGELSWVKNVLPVQTNIVVAELDGLDQRKVLDELAGQDVLAVGFGPGKVRFVTHLDIHYDHLAHTRQVLKRLF